MVFLLEWLIQLIMSFGRDLCYPSVNLWVSVRAAGSVQLQCFQRQNWSNSDCLAHSSQNGNIFCALKTCQPITCSSPLSVPNTCCLVCKGRQTPTSWGSTTARARPPLRELASSRCFVRPLDRGTGGFSSTEDGSLQLNRGVVRPHWRSLAAKIHRKTVAAAV